MGCNAGVDGGSNSQKQKHSVDGRKHNWSLEWTYKPIHVPTGLNRWGMYLSSSTLSRCVLPSGEKIVNEARSLNEERAERGRRMLGTSEGEFGQYLLPETVTFMQIPSGHPRFTRMDRGQRYCSPIGMDTCTCSTCVYTTRSTTPYAPKFLIDRVVAFVVVIRVRLLVH